MCCSFCLPIKDQEILLYERPMEEDECPVCYEPLGTKSHLFVLANMVIAENALMPG